METRALRILTIRRAGGLFLFFDGPKAASEHSLGSDGMKKCGFSVKMLRVLSFKSPKNAENPNNK